MLFTSVFGGGCEKCEIWRYIIELTISHARLRHGINRCVFFIECVIIGVRYSEVRASGIFKHLFHYDTVTIWTPTRARTFPLTNLTTMMCPCRVIDVLEREHCLLFTNNIRQKHIINWYYNLCVSDVCFCTKHTYYV